ncbi:hypothetical protein C1H76_6483 [Elsinoe australis]|uniref:NAD(P)-binding protein n=1 Tax=Elsinoe australis TaxID=40998 RepID=A0A4U7ATP6_9PEZI|nr:hypothetical protein C1H76_6483 [Elsinoe australis]
MNPWALVTPASRGIGLEVARRLLRTTNLPIVTTARKDLDQTRENVLTGLDGVEEDRLHVLRADVLDESTLDEAAKQCSELFPKKDNYLHISFALPGLLFPEKSPQQIKYEDALLTFQTNTLGPMMLLKHFSPFLPKKSTKLSTESEIPKSAVWATLSARVGSIGDNSLGGWYSYRASKAGVNQMTKTFDNYLKTSAGENAMAIALHPGTVKTGLSKDFWNTVKPEKLFTPEFAAEKLIEVVNGKSMNDRGKCFDWKGEVIPP